MAIAWQSIRDVGELNEIISSKSPTLILKHSPTCSISGMAKSRLERSPDDRLRYFIIDVLSQRVLSNTLSEITSVKHESPQAYLFLDGKLVEVSSHISISPHAISGQLTESRSEI